MKNMRSMGSMKKVLLTLTMALVLAGGSMTVKAYDDTFDGVQCYCDITGEKEVMAYTAVGFDNITVVIRSVAYDDKRNFVCSGGNAGGGYAVTKYSVDGPYIFCAVQDHEVPLYGIIKTLTAYPI